MKARPSKSHGLDSESPLAFEAEQHCGHSEGERIAAKVKRGSALISALITSAAKIEMMFVSSNANENNETPRNLDDLEIACK